MDPHQQKLQLHGVFFWGGRNAYRMSQNFPWINFLVFRSSNDLVGFANKQLFKFKMFSQGLVSNPQSYTKLLVFCLVFLQPKRGSLCQIKSWIQIKSCIQKTTNTYDFSQTLTDAPWPNLTKQPKFQDREVFEFLGAPPTGVRETTNPKQCTIP